MKNITCHRFVALVLALCLTTSMSMAQPVQRLDTEQERLSYSLGIYVYLMLSGVIGEFDADAAQQAAEDALQGQSSALTERRVEQIDAKLTEKAQAIQEAGSISVDFDMGDITDREVGLFIGEFVIAKMLWPIRERVDLNLLGHALKTRMTNQPTSLSDEEANAILAEFSRRWETEQSPATPADPALAELDEEALQSIIAQNKDEETRFLAANARRPGVVTTDSGLQYMVLRQGVGARPKDNDVIRIAYRSQQLNGEILENTRPVIRLPSRRVDTALTLGLLEGVKLMPIGAKYRFWIPAALTHDPQNTFRRHNPTEALLIYDVELLSVLPSTY